MDGAEVEYARALFRAVGEAAAAGAAAMRPRELVTLSRAWARAVQAGRAESDPRLLTELIAAARPQLHCFSAGELATLAWSVSKASLLEPSLLGGLSAQLLAEQPDGTLRLRELDSGELVMLTMALRIARRSARGQPELLDALGDELALRQTELTSRERRMVASAFAYLGHEQPLHAVQDSGEEFFVG